MVKLRPNKKLCATSGSKQGCLFFDETALVNSSVHVEDQRSRSSERFSFQLIRRQKDSPEDPVFVDGDPLHVGGHEQALALTAGQQMSLVCRRLLA
jgi:hypothetical protein